MYFTITIQYHCIQLCGQTNLRASCVLIIASAYNWNINKQLVHKLVWPATLVHSVIA